MRDLDHNVLQKAFARHVEAVEKSMKEIMPSVQRGSAVLLSAFNNKKRLFMCGNGGSAADSQHFAAEWLCRYKDDRPPMPAIALTTDTSTLTAIANDYDFEQVFARKVDALGSEGDVLVAFTTSGQSKNILAAIKKAKERGMKVIALTGSRGRSLESRVDVAVVVPSDETARIQEIHQIVYHVWCEFVDAHYVHVHKNDTQLS